MEKSAIEEVSLWKSTQQNAYIYYTQNPNCHKDEVTETHVYHTSACEDMEHVTGIIDATSVSSVVGLRVV
jgi:hypothetical protein